VADGGGPFRLPVGTAEAHAVLRSIEMPLTLVRTHAPSLEDAYMEIVSRAELSTGTATESTETSDERG
jgi:hypothetical protein